MGEPAVNRQHPRARVVRSTFARHSSTEKFSSTASGVRFSLNTWRWRMNKKKKRFFGEDMVQRCRRYYEHRSLIYEKEGSVQCRSYGRFPYRILVGLWMRSVHDFASTYDIRTQRCRNRKWPFPGTPHPSLFFSSQGTGCHSSTLLPSGSMIHANVPFSCDSGPLTISTPAARSWSSISARSSTR